MPSNWRNPPRPGEKSAEQGNRITGNTGKSVDGERDSAGSVVARKRSNVCGAIVSRRREQRHAVREMRVDPSEPPCRGRFQTAISCFGPMAAVVNVMVKRRGI